MSVKFGFWRSKRKTANQFRPQSRHYSNLLDRVREYVVNYNPKTNNDWLKNRITKEKIAADLKVKVHLVEKCLQELNIEGLVTQPEHRKGHDEVWARDSYNINRKYVQEETVHSIFNPPYDYTVSKGTLGYFEHAHLIGLYNSEKYYINQVSEVDIVNWDWKTKKRRSELLDKIILKSKVLCCYLIKCNENLDKDEYTKCMGVIASDYISSFWAIFHLLLSCSDRKRLVEKVASTPAFSSVYLNCFDRAEERKLIINKILYSSYLNLVYDLVTSQYLNFNEQDSIMIADRILELNDMNLAVQANKHGSFCLCMTAKQKLTHLLVAAKLMGRLK